jgi:PadR family transcriptional regulator, regulatory protein PadR
MNIVLSQAEFLDSSLGSRTAVNQLESHPPTHPPGRVVVVAATAWSHLRHYTYGHCKGSGIRSYAMSKGHAKGVHRLEVLQGTLDLMVLQVLDTIGAQHGYGIARRIEQVSGDILKLNEGTVYTALLRLQHERWISTSWGTSENNRKAKFYTITAAGRRQLAREVDSWDRLAGVIARLRTLEGP